MTLESRFHWCEIHNYVTLYLYLTWPESSWMPAEPLSVPPVTLQPPIPRDDTRALPGRGLLLLPGCPDCRAHCKPQGFVSPPSTFPLHLLGYANNGVWNGTKLRCLAWTTQCTHARFFHLAQLESSVSQGICVPADIHSIFLLQNYLQDLHHSMIIWMPFNLPLTWVAYVYLHVYCKHYTKWDGTACVIMPWLSLRETW